MEPSPFLNKIYKWWLVLLILAALTVIYLAVIVPWMNRWGASDSVLSMPLPGDGVETGRVPTSTRAVVVNAPASETWKWLVQIGQERAGFYSNDWLENLTFSDIHNTNEIRPVWQNRAQGDFVAGAGGIYGTNTGWHIAIYEPGKALYLWGPIAVVPLDSETSLLVTRTYAPPSSGLVKTLSALSYDPAHFVMERGMLLGIKQRAEGTYSSLSLVRFLSAIGWVAASLGVCLLLFRRQRGWWWGLIPLGYAAFILFLTFDPWSAMAGFLMLGIPTAGFLLFGRRWWKGLLLVIATVLLVLVLTPEPHAAFGLIFLFVEIGLISWKISQRKRFPAGKPLEAGGEASRI